MTFPNDLKSILTQYDQAIKYDKDTNRRSTLLLKKLLLYLDMDTGRL